MSQPVSSPFTRVPVLPEDVCWPWLGETDIYGYGVCYMGNGHKMRAHRVVYEILVELIPDGLVIDHLCRNRICVNPTHMEPVTVSENSRRQERATRTHCMRGHAFDAANTTIKANGTRQCKQCNVDRQREIRRLAKEAKTA